MEWVLPPTKPVSISFHIGTDCSVAKEPFVGCKPCHNTPASLSRPTLCLNAAMHRPGVARH